MGVFHVFKFVQMVPNRATHHIMKSKNDSVKTFKNICDWFVDKKLSIHFAKDKTKSIRFTSKWRADNVHHLNIRSEIIKIKQYLQVS